MDVAAQGSSGRAVAPGSTAGTEVALQGLGQGLPTAGGCRQGPRPLVTGFASLMHAVQLPTSHPLQSSKAPGLMLKGLWHLRPAAPHSNGAMSCPLAMALHSASRLRGAGACKHNTQCHGCFSLLLLHADRVALRCIRRSVSIVCFSNSCNLLVHDYITSLGSWQPRTTRGSQCSLSPLHVEKSIRGSRRAVNVSCANITGSETSVAMETLKARLISRINYDKKLFMVLYYK